jgi:glucoamylase
MWNCASKGGLLPEQVWDTEAIEARGLEPGRPSGSAMPLLWAHAEFLKLVIAQESRRPVEMLQRVEKRYGGSTKHAGAVWHWRDEVPVWYLQAGKSLCVEARCPFVLHFGFDDWQEIQERDAQQQPFGMWSVLLSGQEIARYGHLDFTRRYDSGWEGLDHQVSLGQQLVTQALSKS